MSSVYNLEPPTKGKVTLKTTLGDIDVELWPKEAPKAVRNFVQLCMEGYYDGTVFHRVIKDFMIQGGDPTGTGRGGDSIYGDYFKDEFHSRLKFNHRGVIACANENEPHTNASQFFITLDACPHLDRKHTIFGKVVGDSIYNVAHFNELNVDKDDRPLELPRFLTSEILWNPFEDIVPRITKEERAAEAAASREKEAKLKDQQRKKRKKNLGLLSFGEEDGEEGAAIAENGQHPKMKSVFDADVDDPRFLKSGTEAAEALAAQEAAEEAERKQRKAKLKTMLLKERLGPAEDLDGQREPPGNLGAPDNDDEEADFAQRMRAKAQAQRSKHSHAQQPKERQDDASDDNSDDSEKGRGKKKTRDRHQEAMASGRIKPAHVQPAKLLAQQDTNLMSDFERKRREAMERSKLAKEKGNNIAKLMTFKKRLAAGQGASHAAIVSKAMPDKKRPKPEVAEEEPDVNLPAAWRIDKFLDDYEDEKFDSLAKHKLEFIKVNPKSDAMAANFDDDYKVEDPLLDQKKTWDRKTGAERRRNREWASNLEAPVD